MKALIFIGLLILTIAHPAIGIVAILFYFMIVGIAVSFSGGGSNRLDRNIVYRHEVVVRETIYASPSYQRAAHLQAEQVAPPKTISPEELQNKLARVHFHQFN
jgi:hypothetical protein